MPGIAAIVLAAGMSSRMGANKLTLPLKGKPLIRHAVEAALTGGADPVIVVTGHNRENIGATLAHLKVSLVENVEYSMGLSASLKRGIRSVPDSCAGAVVLLGDMPFVTAQLIERLVAGFDSARGRLIGVPTFRGRRGNPVLWGRQFFPEILALEGDGGAKPLLERHSGLVFEMEASDDGPLIDIDTPEQLEAFQSHE